MKKFQLLMLDAGPVIGLFEMGLWDKFIEKCDVIIGRTVVREAQYARREIADVRIDIQPYESEGKITVIDLDTVDVQRFRANYLNKCNYRIDDGEMELLGGLFSSEKPYKLCTADGPVFQILARYNKSEQGISLEEVLNAVGLSRSQLSWIYTKKFREKHTKFGQMDAIQNFE
jgi:hypothetical protein